MKIKSYSNSEYTEPEIIEMWLHGILHTGNAREFGITPDAVTAAVDKYIPSINPLAPKIELLIESKINYA